MTIKVNESYPGVLFGPSGQDIELTITEIDSVYGLKLGDHFRSKFTARVVVSAEDARECPFPSGDAISPSLIHMSKKGAPVSQQQSLEYTDHIAGKKEFFILWNPMSPQPPKVTFCSEEHAWEVAEEMAARNDGQKFFVMKSMGCAHVEKPVVRKTYPTRNPRVRK